MNNDIITVTKNKWKVGARWNMGVGVAPGPGILVAELILYTVGKHAFPFSIWCPWPLP